MNEGDEANLRARLTPEALKAAGRSWELARASASVRRGIAISLLIFAGIFVSIVASASADWFKDIDWATSFTSSDAQFQTALIVRAIMSASAMVFAGVLVAFAETLTRAPDVPDVEGADREDGLDGPRSDRPSILKPWDRLGWFAAKHVFPQIQEIEDRLKAVERLEHLSPGIEHALHRREANLPAPDVRGGGANTQLSPELPAIAPPESPP